MSRRKSFFKSWKWRILRLLLVLSLSLFFFSASIGIIWFSSLQIPDLSVFEERKVAQSTKIFDRTGEILLYDIHSDARRTIVSFNDISQNLFCKICFEKEGILLQPW